MGEVIVLMLHNRYQQAGGEDTVVVAEKDLLESRGNDVHLYEVDNDSIVGLTKKLGTAVRAFYNGKERTRVARVIAKVRPDVMHVHNFFPKLSPAVYDAARQHHVPIVQTLHNYRLLCANAMLSRGGRVCEACVGRVPLAAVRYRCYRDSLAGSAVVATMLEYHRLKRTWSRKVDLFVALTEFARERFVAGGIERDRIAVKPNFVVDRFADLPVPSESGAALFVGRLAQEKGIGTLLSAWESLKLPLKVAGDGPLRNMVERAAHGPIDYLGVLSSEGVAREMRRARFLVVPSLSYEGCPRVVVEAMAAGLPVIASELGSLSEVVEDGRTGLLFRAGDATDLKRAVQAMVSSFERSRALGAAARSKYLALFTPERGYDNLMEVYARAERASRLR